jgi:D-aminopeptidase
MTGALYVEEFGFLEAPLLLTNTLAVGAAASGLLKWMVAKGLADGSSESVIPTVAECDDSYLNDIWGAHVGDGEVRLALDSASADFPQGSVGGGTGMSCLGFKGGIGSSSRVARVGGRQHVVGVLVQANFGTQEALTLRGVPVGRLLGAKGVWGQGEGGGSIITVVATDAPLSSRQLKRLARRTFLGLARVGSTSANGSGDISLAFSTANRVDYFGEVEIVNEARMGDRYLSPLFQAVVEATEEAVVNALFTAETVVGRDGHVSRELPVEDVLALLEGPPIS